MSWRASGAPLAARLRRQRTRRRCCAQRIPDKPSPAGVSLKAQPRTSLPLTCWSKLLGFSFSGFESICLCRQLSDPFAQHLWADPFSQSMDERPIQHPWNSDRSLCVPSQLPLQQDNGPRRLCAGHFGGSYCHGAVCESRPRPD